MQSCTLCPAQIWPELETCHEEGHTASSFTPALPPSCTACGYFEVWAGHSRSEVRGTRCCNWHCHAPLSAYTGRRHVFLGHVLSSLTKVVQFLANLVQKLPPSPPSLRSCSLMVSSEPPANEVPHPGWQLSQKSAFKLLGPSTSHRTQGPHEPSDGGARHSHFVCSLACHQGRLQPASCLPHLPSSAGSTRSVHERFPAPGPSSQLVPRNLPSGFSCVPRQPEDLSFPPQETSGKGVGGWAPLLAGSSDLYHSRRTGNTTTLPLRGQPPADSPLCLFEFLFSEAGRQ